MMSDLLIEADTGLVRVAGSIPSSDMDIEAHILGGGHSGFGTPGPDDSPSPDGPGEVGETPPAPGGTDGQDWPGALPGPGAGALRHHPQLLELLDQAGQLLALLADDPHRARVRILGLELARQELGARHDGGERLRQV